MNTMTREQNQLPQTPAQTEDNVLQLELDIIEIARRDMGLHERDASDLARTLVQGLRCLYGGLRLGARGLYIPAPSKRERDEAIRREFVGGNAGDVMRRHGISRSRLYQIVGAPRSSVDARPRIGASAAASPAQLESPASSHEIGRHSA